MVEQPQDPLDYRPDDEELHNGCGECNGRRSYRWWGTAASQRSSYDLAHLWMEDARPTREVDKRIQFSKELATWATGLKRRLRMVSQRREGPDLQGAEGDHEVERALSFRSSTFPQGL